MIDLWLIYFVLKNGDLHHFMQVEYGGNSSDSAEVFRKFCPKDQASEAFEWALILVGVVLVRAIKESEGHGRSWTACRTSKRKSEDPRTYID